MLPSKKSHLPISALLLLFLLSGCNMSTTEATPHAKDISATSHLPGGTWLWQGTFMNNDTEIKPRDPTHFQLTFESDDQVRLLADCNRARATIETNEHRLTFGPIMSTKAACSSSPEDQRFLRDLSHISRWMKKDNQLILELKMDSGIMIFDPKP